MARKIDTADIRDVTLRGGRVIVVQEFASFGFMQAVGSIRKIVTRIRESGDLEVMFRGLWDAAPEEGGDRKVNINQLVELLEMVMSAMGDDPDPLFKIIELSIRDGDTKFTADDAHNLMVEDVVSILKAIYELNFTKLKKALTKAGLVKETNENDPSPSPLTNSQTTPKQPSTTPAAS